MKFEYLKFRYKMNIISSILDIPILILLWWLGYTTGFWILLVLLILNELVFASFVKNWEEELGLRD